MSLFSSLPIYCAMCGSLVDYQKAWRSGLGNVYVCGKQCHDDFDLAYSRMILRKEQPVKPVMHFVSEFCKGEICGHCGNPATHKVGEEISFDEPQPELSDTFGFPPVIIGRHNLTAYVCCERFRQLFGPAAPCFKEVPPVNPEK